MACSAKALLISLLLYFLLWSHATEGGRWIPTREEDLELERQLKILDKPYVKSYKVENGDVFDCVDVYKQPAFDHPLLKNHTIQNSIGEQPREGKFAIFGLKEGCPTGTVPIQRTRKDDLLRAKMYSHHHHIKPSYHIEDDIREGNHYAVIILNDGRRYYGAQALMDVFELPKVKENQISSAQIILIKGKDGPANYINTIQFGWHVFNQLNGDNKTHFFVYWTSDNYQHTGCYNTVCPGYVQVDRFVTPGMVLDPGFGEIKLAVYRDPSTLNWLLKEQRSGRLIGYFPKEIFNNMADVSEVQMGGIVYMPPKDRTFPPMGSGIHPGEPGKACEFKQVGLMNGGGVAGTPNMKVSRYADVPDFYTVTDPKISGDSDGFNFQFGGSGETIW